jgi:hypothetical protein
LILLYVAQLMRVGSPDSHASEAASLGFLLRALLVSLFNMRMDHVTDRQLQAAADAMAAGAAPSRLVAHAVRDTAFPLLPRDAVHADDQGQPGGAAADRLDVDELVFRTAGAEGEEPLPASALEELRRLGLAPEHAMEEGGLAAQAVRRVEGANRRVRPLLQLLLGGSAKLQRVAKAAVVCLPMEVLVQAIDAGCLRPLVAMLGVGAAEGLAYFLLMASNAGRGDGEWVGEVALTLGKLVAQVRVSYTFAPTPAQRVDTFPPMRIGPCGFGTGRQNETHTRPTRLRRTRSPRYGLPSC